MKTKLLLFISLFLLVGNCFGQIMFQKIISTPFGCGANAIQQTTDGGYIIAGNAFITDSNNSNVYVIKTNNEGDTLWTKTFLKTYIDQGSFIEQTTDSGYIIVGLSFIESPNSNIYIVKTNANGDTLWTRSYGGDTAVRGFFCQQTNDGGYIITGNIGDFVSGHANAYLLKINAGGDITWTKTYGGSDYDLEFCVKQTSDSGYIICGNTDSFGAGDYDIYLIKTNINGDTLWTKTYGGTNFDAGQVVQQTTDDGYIIVGSTTRSESGVNDICLIKTNDNGDTLWTRTYGGTLNDVAADVQQTTDSGYIISGITNSFGGGGNDVYLIKTNAKGDTLWTKTYGGTGDDFGESVRQTTDGGYIIAGITESFSHPTGTSNVYLIKTDAYGNSGCNQSNTNTIVGFAPMKVSSTQTIVGSGGTAGSSTTIVGSGGNDSTLCLTVGINELSLNTTISIYPNPATDQLIITGNWKESRSLKLSIYNMLGERIYTETVNSKQSTVNCHPFSSGVYFITVADENEQWVGRFVKE